MKNCVRVVVFFAVFLLSCGKEDEDNFPYILVDKTFSLQDPEFSSLKTPGTAIEVPKEYGVQGVGGLILYNSSGVIKAYDRRSPASLEKQCNVRLNSTLTCIDDCSGTIFQLSDGSRISGESGLPLRRYQVIQSSGSTIRVIN